MNCVEFPAEVSAHPADAFVDDEGDGCAHERGDDPGGGDPGQGSPEHRVDPPVDQTEADHRSHYTVGGRDWPAVE